MSVAEKMTAIAEAIREKTGKTDKLSLDEMASEIRGIEAGDAWYDTFWDAFQGGDITDYMSYFAGQGWTDATFKPKYDIIPTAAANNMFGISRITDLSARLNECGVVLDLSHTARVDSMFYYAKQLTKVPALVLNENITNIAYMFCACVSLRTIEGLTIPEKTIDTSGAFESCYALEEIRLVNPLWSDLNLQWSEKLSRNSIDSIYWAAHEGADASGTTPTVTFSQTAVDAAYSSEEWQAMVDNGHCNITLI